MGHRRMGQALPIDIGTRTLAIELGISVGTARLLPRWV